MPTDKINDVKLYWEVTGQEGDPMVLVHGSWGDHNNWKPAVNELSNYFRVLTYDRRGHSKSERLQQQGSAAEDVSDLIALMEYLNFSPAHIVGNSGGAAIVLKTALKKPDFFKTLIVHEPPLFGLLTHNDEARPMLQIVNDRIRAVVDLIVTGEYERAAELFVETIAFGPGSWKQLPANVKQTFVYNAPTFLDEIGDSDNTEFDIKKIGGFHKPALLSHGTESPPFFVMVLNEIKKAMPQARRFVFKGAGHVPHLSHPQQYVQMVTRFANSFETA